MMDEARFGQDRDFAAWAWVAVVALSSLGLSRAFACAAPFAAVATVAALTLPRRHAVTLVLLVWLGNQAIGFGLLHYPHTASAVGWGGAIGVAALTALATTEWVGARVRRGGVVAAAIGLAAGFAGFEAVLGAATGVLPSGSGAFAPTVLLRIFSINAVALGLFLAARRLAAAAGLQVRRPLPIHHGRG